MIAVGQRQRDLATRGFGAVSKAESVEDQQRLALEAQEKAAESQVLGTGAGIGGISGATSARALSSEAGSAIKNANTLLGDAGTLSRGKLSGGIQFTPTGGETIKGIEGLNAAKDAAALKDAAVVTDAAAAGQTAATVAEGAAAVEGAAVAGEAAVAVEGAAAASTAAAPMAQLAALATPVAIGLGVAYLINKLFD
jgi:hypothetical protein